MQGLVFNVGINDADYTVSKFQNLGMVNGVRKNKVVWLCPYYIVWKNMLARCYAVNRQRQHMAYIGCSVCAEWLTFSKFKAWMETQDWEGKHLDKDILVHGNNIYSPNTCVFVSPALNMFLTGRAAMRGDYPIGVSFHKKSGKFCSSISNPFSNKQEHLGLFITPEEAASKWLTRKREFAKIYAELQDNYLVSLAILKRYELEELLNS